MAATTAMIFSVVTCILLSSCPAIAGADAARQVPKAGVSSPAAAEAITPLNPTADARDLRKHSEKREGMVPLDPPWKKKLELLAARRDVLSTGLSQSHARLRAVVTAERPDLLPRLEKETPKATATGHGILPPIKADEPELTDVSPIEQSYSIAELRLWVDKELALLAELDSRLEIRPPPLEREIDFYNDRAETFRILDAHFGYHSFWQDQVLKWPLFWERKKQLLALYRTWRAPLQAGAGALQTPDARDRLENEMLKFTPSPALCLRRETSGWSILPVRIATDITDELFLAAFSEAVERHWNESQAMKESHLRIDLTWDRRSPESLYPEGAPRQGERIDAARHRERFGSAPLVLTTGTDSTHVLHAAIFLGPRPTTRRVLAHEFAHLLGFDDAYIRAYDGSIDQTDGVVFREVTPFPESLLATPRRGKVTPRMVEVLRDAYRGCGSGS